MDSRAADLQRLQRVLDETEAMCKRAQVLQAARRPAEIESVVEMRRHIVHIDDLEADALAKGRGSTDLWPFKRGKPIGVLPCPLPPGPDRIVRGLICGDNGASARGEECRQRLVSDPEA